MEAMARDPKTPDWPPRHEAAITAADIEACLDASRCDPADLFALGRRTRS